MRVWLVTAAEPIPSDGVRPMRFMGLARALAGRGHEVTLWTQTFLHHTKRHRFPGDTEYEAEGYRVVALRAFGYRRNVLLRRYASHWRFAQRLADEMPRRAAPDVVVASLPPLDYCAGRGVPFVVDVIDPWPDVFVDLLPPAVRSVGRMLSAPLSRRARRIFTRAHSVTGLSEQYVGWARRLAAPREVPGRVFYPAADIEAFDRLAAAQAPAPEAGPLRVVRDVTWWAAAMSPKSTASGDPSSATTRRPETSAEAAAKKISVTVGSPNFYIGGLVGFNLGAIMQAYAVGEASRSAGGLLRWPMKLGVPVGLRREPVREGDGILYV